MIVPSPYPDVVIPDVPLTRFVFQNAARFAGKPALVDGPSGRTLTYGELALAVRRAAGGLRRRGLKKGEAVAIYSHNLPEYAVLFHAVATLGGVSTTANPLATAEELAKQLQDSGARFLVTAPPFLEKAQEAARAAGVEEVFVFGEAAGATPFTAFLERGEATGGVEIEPAADLVALPYSSGTTGLPKGVMLTHRNLVANLVQIGQIDTATEKDTAIGVLPFFHIYGLVVILNYGLWRGMTIVTMPRFEIESFLRLLQNHGVTRAYLVPPIILALAKQPVVDDYDLSRLRHIMSGAAPLGEDVARECAARLRSLVKQGYGLTETSPVTHMNPDDPARVKIPSVGPAVPSTHCRIVDPATGQDLGPGERGELWIRGPQVMKGYLHQPEITARTVDGDGWLRTGDVGYADEDGYFYVVDRLKELIKYKGLQVAPAELEAVLLSHPAIADAAVIPSPDPEAGEVPKAFVVLKGPVATDEILEYVAARVAPYKKLRRLEVVEEIPKSASGKILRRVLVEKERGGAPR